MPPNPKKNIYRIVLVSAIAIVGIFAALGWLQTVFFGLTDTIEAYAKVHPIVGPFLFILFAALSVMLGPATSAPLVPLAVVVWGPPLTFIYLFVGWVFGNMGAYAIGYYFGYPAVKKMMKKEKFDRWNVLLDRKVTLLVAFIVRIATPSETGYLFGIARYHFAKFVLVSILAELPFAIVMVYAGQALVEAGWWTFMGFGLIYAAFIMVGILLLKRLTAREAE